MVHPLRGAALLRREVRRLFLGEFPLRGCLIEGGSCREEAVSAWAPAARGGGCFWGVSASGLLD